MSAQYAKEKQLLTNESDSRLKKCEEERMKMETINSQLELLVKEKDKLVQEHVSEIIARIPTWTRVKIWGYKVSGSNCWVETTYKAYHPLPDFGVGNKLPTLKLPSGW